MKLFLSFLFFLLSISLLAQQGSLLVVGGGSESNDYPESWSTQAYSWAVSRTANKKVAVIHYDDTGNWLKPYFTEHCGAVESENFVINSSNANDEELMNTLMGYDMFFFRGGDQYYYYRDYNGTLMEQAMKDKFSEGGVLAGTSAGLAIMSEVIFSAANGSAYSDVTIKDIYNSKIRLADDFLDVAPGFIFDSHFTNRGRMGRLIAFMANYEKETGKRITGIGVDETTALGITPENLGIAFGTRSVCIYYLPEKEEFGPGPILTVENINVKQLVHGDTINLETMDIQGLPLETTPRDPIETKGRTIYLSGSDEISSANSSLLGALVQDGNAMDDEIVILTGNSLSLATEIKNQLESQGATKVKIWQALYENVEDLTLEIDLQQAAKIVFTDNNTYNLNVFLVSGSNGNLLKTRLSDPELITAFIGDNSRFAGPWIVNNYLSGSAGLSLAEGLKLLKTTCIIPKTFDPPGGSTDSWYSTHLALPYAMVKEKLAYGIWLNNDNYIVYNAIDGELYFTAYGESPVMFMEMTSGYSGFTEMTYNGQPNEIPLNVAGFDNMKLSYLGDGQSVKVGDWVIDSDYPAVESNTRIFPNPARNSIKIEAEFPVQNYFIHDIFGRILIEGGKMNSPEEIDIEFLVPGTYILKLGNKDKVGMNKFVKIH
jgi:cyanophycinase-like exopeptidase